MLHKELTLKAYYLPLSVSSMCYHCSTELYKKNKQTQKPNHHFLLPTNGTEIPCLTKVRQAQLAQTIFKLLPI